MPPMRKAHPQIRTIDPARLAEAAGAAAAGPLLAMMLDHDPATAAHMDRVGELAGRIGRELGLAPQALAHLSLAGRLHDIGKLAIAPAVLRSPEPLTPLEQHRMRRHPVIGEQITRILPIAPEVVRGIRQHHERLNGDGYPDGLAGAEIGLVARIIAVADAFDAMTNPRPYQVLRDPAEALAVLRAEAGVCWDAEVVAALATTLGAAPAERAAGERLAA